MFKNIGRKLKILAVVIFCLGMIAYVALSFLMVYSAAQSNTPALFITAFFFLIAGSFLSWLFASILYGFGELVDNSTAQKAKMGALMRKIDVVLSRQVSQEFPQNVGYAPQSNGYAPQNGSAVPQNYGYAPQNAGYVPQNNGYVPQNENAVPQNSQDTIPEHENTPLS